MKIVLCLTKNLNDLNCIAPKTVYFRLLGSIFVWLNKCRSRCSDEFRASAAVHFIIHDSFFFCIQRGKAMSAA